MSDLKATADKKYQSSGGKKAIPWDIVIQFLKQILSGICPAASVKKLSKDHPIYATAELTRHLMENDDTLSRKEAKLMASASVSTLASASVGDIESL